MSSSPGNNEPAFSLLVTLTFSSLQYKKEFLEMIQPLATHVQQNEPDTLAYHVLQSDRDELQVLILERYANKDHAYLEVHKSSPPFLEFRPKLKALVEAGHVKMEGQSYLDTAVGFVSRTL